MVENTPGERDSAPVFETESKSNEMGENSSSVKDGVLTPEPAAESLPDVFTSLPDIDFESFLGEEQQGW